MRVVSGRCLRSSLVDCRCLRLEQRMNFTRAITTVTTEGADARELARLRPPGDRLGVNPEECCNLGWGEKVLGIRILARHCASYRFTERVFAALDFR